MRDQHKPSDSDPRADADHADYAEAQAEASVSRDAIRRLNRHAAQTAAPLIVTGAGTTALLAQWALARVRKHPGDACFTHFVGCTGESRRTDRLLERLLVWLRARAGTPDPLPVDADARREVLPNWLARAAARGRLVIVLDAVDALEDDDAGAALEWLPAHLPPNVRMIAGATTDGAVAEQLRHRGWQVEALAGDDHATLEPVPVERFPAAALRLLWASRCGVTAEELAAAGHDAAALGDLVCSLGDRLTLAGPRIRDAVQRRLLADGAERQAAHAALAELVQRVGSASRRLQEVPWQWTAARHWEELATELAAPDTLVALLDQPDRLDLFRYWSAWGDADTIASWYAERIPDWRGRLDRDAFAGLLLGLASALRDMGATDALQPHLDALEAEFDQLPVQLQARALAVRGGWFTDRGDHEAAEAPLRRALALRQEACGPDHPETRTSRHQLAIWHEERGELQQAVALYREALQQRERTLGERDPGLIPYLTNLGAVYKAMDDIAAAKPWYRRALDIAERQHGNSHPTTAACLDNLAGVVYAEHDFDQAETLYQRALGIAETVFGTMHAATAAAAHNLGAVMDAREDFRTAEMLFQRALDIREELFGAEHVDTASTLHNLAGVKDAMGRYTDAEPLYRKAIANWEALVGEQHPATATSVNNLADLLRETGQYDEAEQLYRRNLETWGSLMGGDHPHTLMTLCELAGLFADRQRYQEAEPMLRDAVERTAQVLGRDNMDHINAVTRLAALYRDTGRRDDARQLLKQAVLSVEGTLGMMSPRVQKLRRHLEALDVDPDRLH
ncbi:tetratricopeptide repeat protein [Aquisalimonas asiatica]|uniref:Tetratricopeptide repeat-containing protein n=1 Tax=Aquisalimonas asiatica TaxID=406100 RepID=A0A1H8RL66_9GAMM|nr:tetratricopeptide repeat protein [Aquisalimonas asiatica]SEO67150.1 Tetratricopeptide repeat-containing protein [Aquisalimonas asiatica]